MVREARRSFRLNSLSLEELNFMLGQLGDRLDELEGRRGTPKFKSNVDMGLNRVTQMRSGSVATDGATVVQIDGVEAVLDNLGIATGGVQNLSASATPGANRLVMSPAASQYIDKNWLPADLGARTLVWDKLIGAAVTSVTTDGEVTLDGNAHGGYWFEFVIINDNAGTARYRLYYNNDTTNANYNFHTIYSTGANVFGTFGNEAYFETSGVGTGNLFIFAGSISIDPAGYAMAQSINHNHSATVMETYVHKKIASVANLTRIDIVASVASGIGINSRFRLWRRT